jgi:ABC-type amino acid transport substrate-binding protein
LLNASKGGRMSSLSFFVYSDRARISKSACKGEVVVTGRARQIRGALIMHRNHHLQAHRSTHSPTRSGLAIVAAAILALSLFVGPIYAASNKTMPSSRTSQREQFTIAPEEAMKPWTGDLDAMIKRRVIRILTVYNKTFYFVDKGVQRGSSYDTGRLFVDDLNKKLAKDKKQKHLKVQAVFIPVGRGELLTALVAGKGDIVMSGFGVTEERQKLADFSSPLIPNVSEVVVSGPGSPEISSVDDLAGKQVFVRKSSTKAWWP